MGRNKIQTEGVAYLVHALTINKVAILFVLHSSDN